jgi:hypothetical protein
MLASNLGSHADKARMLLGAIRLLNGGMAFLAPGFLARRLGSDPEANPALLYVLRMFGIRTVLIGADLLVRTGDARAEALRRGIVIHASDTVAAGLAGLTGRLPGRTGLMITLISLGNTLLAICASSGAGHRNEGES